MLTYEMVASTKQMNILDYVGNESGMVSCLMSILKLQDCTRNNELDRHCWYTRSRLTSLQYKNKFLSSWPVFDIVQAFQGLNCSFLKKIEMNYRSPVTPLNFRLLKKISLSCCEIERKFCFDKYMRF
jgi:hypothetical protein